MFAKIKDGKIEFLSRVNDSGNMLQLTDEEYNILSNGGTYDNGVFIQYKKELTQQEEIDKINQNFEKQVAEQVMTGYTNYEIQTWGFKIKEAEKVLEGEGSPFLKALTIDKKKTAVLKFAKLIIQEAEEKFLIYAELEKEKNIALNNLTKK